MKRHDKVFGSSQAQRRRRVPDDYDDDRAEGSAHVIASPVQTNKPVDAVVYALAFAINVCHHAS